MYCAILLSRYDLRDAAATQFARLGLTVSVQRRPPTLILEGGRHERSR